MIRVAHFHSSLGVYGAERWTHLVVRYCDPRRVAMQVVTIGTKPGNDAFSRALAREGVPSRHLPFDGHVNPRALVALRRLLVEQHVDCLHTHGFKTDVLGYLATRGLPIALATTTHGWCDREGWRIRAYETIGRAFLAGFDAIYPVSDHQADFLRGRRLRGRIHVIRNAVDVAAFDDVLARRRRRPASGRLLFVGRIGREKGIFDLVDAIAVARAHGTQVALDVVGDGPGRDEAERAARSRGLADRVAFHGYRDDVRPFLESAAAVVLPSYGEGLPRVLMEAGAAGVAAVGTRVPGIVEIVRDRETGLLVEAGDPASLASAIEHVAAHPDEMRALGERARAHVESERSPRRMTEELVAEYERLCAP